MASFLAFVRALGFIQWIVEFVRQMKKEAAIQKADATHAENASAIDAAFPDLAGGVPEFTPRPRPSETAAESPSVSSGSGGSAPVVEGSSDGSQRPAAGEPKAQG